MSSSATKTREDEKKEWILKATRVNDETKNPCLKESRMSQRCLDRNDYDGERCQEEFQNYINCKEFWRLVSSDRRRAFIRPHLPPPEERDQIKREYMDERNRKIAERDAAVERWKEDNEKLIAKRKARQERTSDGKT